MNEITLETWVKSLTSALTALGLQTEFLPPSHLHQMDQNQEFVGMIIVTKRGTHCYGIRFFKLRKLKDGNLVIQIAARVRNPARRREVLFKNYTEENITKIAKFAYESLDYLATFWALAASARANADLSKKVLVRHKGGTAEETVPLDKVRIPDLWHIAQAQDAKETCDSILEVWNLAHDMLKALREQASSVIDRR